MEGEKWPTDSAGLFGWNLRLLRDRAGISQPEFARLMQERGHRWHQSTVYRVESGKQELKAAELVDAARILRTSMERFTWTGPEANEAEFVYQTGARVMQFYGQTVEAAHHLVSAINTATRTVDRHKDSKYERVRGACEDVTLRIENHGPHEAVDEGINRYREETEHTDDDVNVGNQED